MKHIKLFEDYIFNNSDYESEFEFGIDVKIFIEKILKKLNIDYGKIEVLSEGSNGIAFDLGDKVLKLTSDSSEAFYANNLINIKSENLVKIFSVNEIVSDYIYGKMFVIIQEKLQTNFNSSIKHIINDLNQII